MLQPVYRIIFPEAVTLERYKHVFDDLELEIHEVENDLEITSGISYLAFLKKQGKKLCRALTGSQQDRLKKTFIFDVGVKAIENPDKSVLNNFEITERGVFVVTAYKSGIVKILQLIEAYSLFEVHTEYSTYTWIQPGTRPSYGGLPFTWNLDTGGSDGGRYHNMSASINEGVIPFNNRMQAVRLSIDYTYTADITNPNSATANFTYFHSEIPPQHRNIQDYLDDYVVQKLDRLHTSSGQDRKQLLKKEYVVEFTNGSNRFYFTKIDGYPSMKEGALCYPRNVYLVKYNANEYTYEFITNFQWEWIADMGSDTFTYRRVPGVTRFVEGRLDLVDHDRQKEYQDCQLLLEKIRGI